MLNKRQLVLSESLRSHVPADLQTSGTHAPKIYEQGALDVAQPSKRCLRQLHISIGLLYMRRYL
jgi:hypothetical protein